MSADIKNIIHSIVDEKVKCQCLEKPVKQNFISSWLLPSIIALAAIIAYLGYDYYKSNYTPETPSISAKDSLTILEMNERLIRQDNIIKQLQSIIQSQETRISVLGIMTNENVQVIKELNYDDPRKNDLISFERNWMLNRVPSRLNLTDSDKNFIRQNVSK